MKGLSLGVTLIALASAVLLLSDRDRRTAGASADRVYRVAIVQHPALRGDHEVGVIPVNACRSNSPLYTGKRFLGCRARFEHP